MCLISAIPIKPRGGSGRDFCSLGRIDPQWPLLIVEGDDRGGPRLTKFDSRLVWVSQGSKYSKNDHGFCSMS